MTPKDMEDFWESKGLVMLEGDVYVLQNRAASFLVLVDAPPIERPPVAMRLDSTQWRALAQVAATIADLLDATPVEAA